VYPATQKHPELPAWESAFAPQSWHWTEAVLSANLPAAHSAHAADPDVALYFPIPHAAHVPPVCVRVCQKFLDHCMQPSNYSMQPSLTHFNPRSRCVCLLLQYLIQSCWRGGRRIVEDMCYEIRRAEACVD
jgi:hypothetical protein